MFYSVHVLGKKGPLARVWLAAHWDKKITKAQILETNIVESVDSILQPRVKLSLRTSSHLLLGIVRIYARKTAYLLQDCQEAAFKIKSAFRVGTVDLPDGKTEAAIAAITLPETFDFDLIAEPPMQIESVQSNANIRNITLSDEIVSINIDDDLYINEVQNNWSDLSSINASSSKNDITLTGKDNNLWQMYDRPTDGDGFGGSFNDVDDLFALPVPAEMQKQPEYQKNPIESGTLLDDNHLENGKDLLDNDIDMPFDDRPLSRMSVYSDMSYGAPPSLAPSSAGSLGNDLDDTLMPHHHQNSNDNSNNHFDHDKEELRQDENSLFNNKQANNLDSLVLEPIEQGFGFERRKKRRKKLGILVDDVKTLSGEEMKAQLSDTTDIVAELDLAPPSKKLMTLKRTAGIEKLFGNPIIHIPSIVISIYFTSNLTTTKLDSEQDYYLNGINDDNNSTISSEFRRPIDPVLPDLDDDYNNQSFVPPQSPLREIQQPKTPRSLRKELANEKSSKKKRKFNDSQEKIDRPPKTPKMIDNSEQHFSNSQFIINESSDMERMRRDTSNFNNVTTGDSMYIQNEDEDFEYEQPMSVGPPEEMMPEETSEQFEERMRNKRTNVLLRLMANQLDEEGSISFTNLVKSNRRKQVAQKFYSLLVLKKQQAIELYQDNNQPYNDIIINKGFNYDNALVASTV